MTKDYKGDVMTTTEGEYSPKRQHVRTKEKKNCILRLAGMHTAVFVETLNHSKGGLGIIYDGKNLSVGNRVFVNIETLNILNKEAKVVWLKQFNGDYTAGLRWG